MIIVFPVVRRNDWVFRLSVADAQIMMLMAFGPEQKFEMRFFTEPETAESYIKELAGPSETV